MKARLDHPATHDARPIDNGHLRLGSAPQLIDELRRVLDQFGDSDATGDHAIATPYPKRIPIRLSGGTTLYVRVTTIDWIEGASQYVRLHIGARRYLIRSSMHAVESTLNPAIFCRIHRSAILNLRRVCELRIEASQRRWAVLDDGHRLAVSQSRWDALQHALIQSI